eukprot:CAMPEP_0170457576 /NCGR_PEP_ID=MMETSP0123-20130129/4826_1 /TAXON_ID=182087 /ORGANISM="Favella ehrenbergii, Strain Fehren 1" /LENGTH=71 /DNA_ID=CAMNT_0010721423 /DNA_START=138 /DNA_END=353 /DNA_ORIENTATION=-
MRSRLVVHAVPHNTVVAPSYNRETHRERHSTAEACDKEGEDLATFLCIGDITRATVSMILLFSHWVYSTRE